jgi:hypothetical protein
MTGAALGRALAAVGFPCAVAADERVAILHPRGDRDALADVAFRTRIVAIAREHGFTHVALDLTDSDQPGERAGAVVPGD